jgi:hypothetical protein
MPGRAEAVTARDRVIKLAHPVLILLVVTVLAYGLLLAQMGFFWDELPMSWIRYQLGPDAMTRYFSTNRPVWGVLYQLTTSVLPQIPIYWEILALVVRWASAVLVWLMARNLWRGRAEFAAIASLAFLLYPGFNQQWTSFLYGHFFIVLCFLLLSFLCSIWAERRPDRRLELSLGGVILAGLNLWMMEYFFVLELLRPLLIFRVVVEAQPGIALRYAVRRTMAGWWPYLAVFIANVLWRLLVFNNQVYQPTLGASVRAKAAQGVLDAFTAIGQQLFRTAALAWSQIAHFPAVSRDGPRTLWYYVGVVGLAAIAVGVMIVEARRRSATGAERQWWPSALGLIAMLLAGGPFLLTGLEVTIAYPANRFTLPFMLGVSFALAGMLMYLPARLRLGVVIVVMALAAGRQALWAEDFRRDWATQKALFWQMVWRAPGIRPNTTVLMNEGALPYYADNSLIGALNWIYDPRNRSDRMDYALFYPTSRIGGTIPSLRAGLPIHYDFISEVFTGSTSQILGFYFQPPGCLRLLDPEIDAGNRLIPDDTMMRDAAALSSTAWIVADGESSMPGIYGPEPAHGWCYYFERASLAAQSEDWGQVTDLGDVALRLDDHPNDPVERFVFIEGYAHAGNWARAIELSDESYRVSRSYVGPILCRLWQRIERETGRNAGQEAALAEVKSMFSCTRE